MGGWLISHLLMSYILAGCKPTSLLAMGMWPGAAEKNFGLFWHERFTCVFPQRLVQHLVPCLPELELKRKDLGTRCPASFASFVSTIKYLAVVVLQVRQLAYCFWLWVWQSLP